MSRNIEKSINYKNICGVLHFFPSLLLYRVNILLTSFWSSLLSRIWARSFFSSEVGEAKPVTIISNKVGRVSSWDWSLWVGLVSVLDYEIWDFWERGNRWEKFEGVRPRNLGNSLHGENCGKMTRKYLNVLLCT